MASCIQKIFDGIRIGEALDSREREDGQNPSYTERYYVEGTSSSAVATETGRALMVHKYGSPPTYNGLPLLTTRTEPLRGVAAWRFEAVFQPLEVQTEEVAESNYSFSSTSGTANVKYSLETVAAVTVDGRPVRNFYNGINRNDAGGYDGVDLFVPTPEFSMKQSHPMGWFSRSARVLISTLVGCINNAPFDGYAPGELMFKGIDATTARYTDAYGVYQWYWQATYHFAASPNTFIQFGGQDVPKRGWDYSWMLVEKWENTETGDEESRPVQLNIERVYRTMDFSALCLKLPQ